MKTDRRNLARGALRHFAWAVLLLLLSGSTLVWAQTGLPWKLSLDGFIQEVVYGRATPRTSRFDPATNGSYRLEKAELLKGLDRFRSGTDAAIDAVLVIGPYGPIEAYDITLLSHSQNGCQVNGLRFQHQRVLLKSTKALDLRDCRAFLTGVRGAIGDPTTGTDDKAIQRSVLTLGDWSQGSLATYTIDAKSPDLSSRMDPIVAKRAALVADAVVTYSVELPDNQDIVVIREPEDSNGLNHHH